MLPEPAERVLLTIRQLLEEGFDVGHPCLAHLEDAGAEGTLLGTEQRCMAVGEKFGPTQTTTQTMIVACTVH